MSRALAKTLFTSVNKGRFIMKFEHHLFPLKQSKYYSILYRSFYHFTILRTTKPNT